MREPAYLVSETEFNAVFMATPSMISAVQGDGGPGTEQPRKGRPRMQRTKDIGSRREAVNGGRKGRYALNGNFAPSIRR